MANQNLRNWLLAACAAMCVLAINGSVNALAMQSDRPIELQTFSSHSRIVIKIDQGVPTQWKDDAQGFVLRLKGIGLEDLGAPLGGDEAWRKQFDSISDNHVESLRVRVAGEDVLIEGKWKFPKGDQAPANPKMEFFDFRQESPPRYLVDFWPKKGLTVAEAVADQRRKERDLLIKESEDRAKERKIRRIASEKAREDADDIGKYCREPLREGKDVFVRFIPFHEGLDLAKWFSTAAPDREYDYLEPSSPGKDAAYVRKALGLYRQSKWALVVRTLDFLDEEHPDSTFRYEMRFLRANCLLRLGQEAVALKIFNDLIQTPAASTVALQIGMYLAAKNLDKKSYLAALENFMWLIKQYPSHRLNWVFHIGAAETLYALKQTQRAAGEYQWVTENAKLRAQRAEGAVRIGDLFMFRSQYEQALASYFRALTDFGSEAKNFPSLYLNRAEAMYWLGQYDVANKAYLEFLKLFPGHTQGWRAHFRMGEIAHRKNDPKQWEVAVAKYEDTINHGPFSPGATLARLRLLPCGRHGGFDVTTAKSFFDSEAVKFTGAEQVALEGFRDLRGITEIRTWISMGEEDEAIDASIEEIETNPSSKLRQTVDETFRKVLRKRVLALLDSGHQFDALSFYHEKMKEVPEVRVRGGYENVDYLLKLAQVASEFALSGTAQELTADFHSAVKKKMSGVQAGEGDRKIAAQLEDVDLRLKKSEEAYTDAIAIWSDPKARHDQKKQAKIKELLNDVVEESERSFEKEVILGLIDESHKKDASALKHAVRAELLVPKKIKSNNVEFAFVLNWVAELNGRSGDPKAAQQGLAKIRDLVAKAPATFTSVNAPICTMLGLPALGDDSMRLFSEADILAKTGRWGEVASLYSSSIEKGVGGNQALYEYHKALNRLPSLDDQKRAKEILEELSESKTVDFWCELARKALGKK